MQSPAFQRKEERAAGGGCGKVLKAKAVAAAKPPGKPPPPQLGHSLSPQEGARPALTTQNIMTSGM